MGESNATTRHRVSRTAYGLYVSDARRVNLQRKNPPITNEDLVESHLFYVIQVAKEYRNLGIPVEDLMAEGNLGLMEAAGRFDRTRGVKFISYATWWIRKRMWDVVARQVSLVRIPKYRLERMRRIRLVERELRGQLCRTPSVEEIAEGSGLTPIEIDALNCQSHREISLDALVNSDSGLRLEEVVAERSSCSPDSELLRQSSEASLLRYLQNLPPRQRQIIAMHFGLGGAKPTTLAEIGRRLGVSRERVRQVERQGLAQLRRMMQSVGRSATA